MTGRELILYILTNGLENEEVFKDGQFLCFMSEEEAAVKFGVGSATIRLWYQRGILKGTKIGDSIFILKDAVDPRKGCVTNG